MLNINSTAAELIGEVVATTPEDIASWITAMLATFRDLSANQEKHRLRSMTDLSIFMVMDEKYMRVQIVPLITYFFSAEGTTDNDIEIQAIGFRGNFMWYQLPTMVQVTDTAFKNIKVKAPSLLTIR